MLLQRAEVVVVVVVPSVTWSLGLVWDNTADKVWLGAAQVCHQLVQVFLQWQRSSQSPSTELQLVGNVVLLTGGVLGVIRRGASTDLK